VAKANAAVAIISNSPLFADSNTNEEAPTLSCADQQNLISLYYVHIGAPPPEEWNGEGRTMSKIERALSYGKEQRRKVKEVIEKYHFTILVGGKYNPQRKSCTNATVIEDRSHVQQMVCDYIESGVSLTEAQLLVNIWCYKHGERTMTHSAVVLCIQRMKKRVSLIRKCPQGHTDPKSNWARCRICLPAQMLLRFGEDFGEHQHFFGQLLDETGDLPACFDPDLLPKLDLNRIVFHDVRCFCLFKDLT
jgi:hypothetical protein